MPHRLRRPPVLRFAMKARGVYYFAACERGERRFEEKRHTT